ncbi:AraC family transcriptional regulator [Anaerocolumna sp. AGMB13020]|uniref:AraC family transcriptional regulator n=1 Tax=Anaerocolumna sp. AGMB13020 TaxID=3081750 RepID=UPI0029551B39|nr:AraC family transcriptional regulator [Anaerocolumna sp. AGMB13020]WOO35730.1 AraC family transcriptional regulator [Anaerocolumna sp. AGMB13020]
MNDNKFYRDTGKSFFRNGNSIYINYINENTEPHLHVHDFIEISYVASGTGIHIIGDKQYDVGKGDLFLINYHIPHEFRSFPAPTAPLMVYNCVFKPDFIDMNLLDYKEFTDVINYLSFRSIFALESENIEDIKILGVENNSLEAIYKKMLTEFTEKEEGYIELLRVYLIELLIKIFRSYKNSGTNTTTMMSHHAKMIKQSIQYLKLNYSVNTKLTDLAAQSFLSPTYFCKLFKDYAGMTISEYVQRLRIEEACNLLTATEDKVIVIAQKVGYNDIKHFNEVFKRLTGMTPREYKKQIRSK